jgi:hypothetical protein
MEALKGFRALTGPEIKDGDASTSRNRECCAATSIAIELR